jgi:HK97 gp10 family phage protein
MAEVKIRIHTRKAYGGRGIASIQKSVRSNSHAAAYNFARRGSSAAKRRVHVITGYLRDSIHTEMVAPGHHKIVVGANYGVYEEYGTRYRPPHPYLRPAVQEVRAQYLADLRNVFGVVHR